MLALWITLGIIGYLNTGYWWGRLSRRAWKKKRRSIAGLLCFPATYMMNKVGEKEYFDDGMYMPLMTNFNENSDNYPKIMSFIWPLRVVWNVPILAFWLVVNTPALTGLVLTGATKPFRLLHKRFSEEKPAQLPPANPDQFDVDEYHSLLMERDKVNARLKELEAHPDKQKLLQMPRRL